MSLNDIELSASLITTLYGDSILIRSQASQLAPPTAIQSPRTTAAQPAPAAHVSPAARNTPPSASTPLQTASPNTYKFLGNNQKKIAIIVDSPQTAFLPDDQLAFLTKMLEACKMNIGDIAIVNQANTPVDIALLKKELSPATVLLFGAETSDIRLPLNIAFFKIQVYDQCTYLRVPPLGQLLQTGEESKLLKSKLWLCLKQLFEL